MKKLINIIIITAFCSFILFVFQKLGSEREIKNYHKKQKRLALKMRREKRETESRFKKLSFPVYEPGYTVKMNIKELNSLVNWEYETQLKSLKNPKISFEKLGSSKVQFVGKLTHIFNNDSANVYLLLSMTVYEGKRNPFGKSFALVKLPPEYAEHQFEIGEFTEITGNIALNPKYKVNSENKNGKNLESVLSEFKAVVKASGYKKVNVAPEYKIRKAALIPPYNPTEYK
ncbi:MAG: hypothetical protein CSB55_04450 [Candidatus Cloacimonadota bacterium]|nr:MAG: hypothetical protein CSB55_04450 [Candidatus Cloacimonadota bacterium]